MATSRNSPVKAQPRMDAERVRQALQGGVTTVRGLTPDRLNRALEDFSMGYLRDAALLWQKIKDRDDTIKAVAEKRELQAALLDWEILPLDDSAEAKKHQAALEEFYNNLTATHALDQHQRGGVSTLIRQMMHSVGHKYAVHEIVWEPAPTGLTAEFRFVPLQFFEGTLGRLRFLATDHAASGQDLEEGGWMVTTGAGLMEPCAIAYLFKSLPLKSALMFCDKFGLPGLHGETSAAIGSAEWNAFRDALAAYAQDWALLTSAGTKVNPIEVNANGTMPHLALVDRMDRAMARLWRGADLGTMSQDGAAVGSNPQDDETDILEAADAAVISETLQHYVDEQVIAYRFGAAPLAYFQLKTRTRVNLELELKIDEALIRWGVPRAKADLLERYGRPVPAAKDELASAPAPAPSPFALGNEAKAPATFADRLAAALALPDEAARRAALAALAADLPDLLAAPPADDPATRLLETGMAEALAAAAVAALGRKSGNAKSGNAEI